MEATELEVFTDLLVDDLTGRRTAGSGGSGTMNTDDATGPLGLPGLAGLLGGVRAVVDDAALLAVMGAAVRLRNVADALLARVTAVAEQAGIARRKRVKSGADLLAGFSVAPAVAYRAVRVGRELPGLRGLEIGVRNGFVSAEQADAVIRGVNLIGRRVELSDRVRGEIASRLQVQAGPAAVAARAREIALELAAEVDTDDAAGVPVAERADLNEMSLVQTGDGRVEGTLDVDVVCGEELMAALDPLMRPVPGPDGAPDSRSVARRRAEAFGEIVRGYLASAGRPSSGGRLPHVSLILPLPTPTHQKPGACAPPAGPAGPGSEAHGTTGDRTVGDGTDRAGIARDGTARDGAAGEVAVGVGAAGDRAVENGTVGNGATGDGTVENETDRDGPAEARAAEDGTAEAGAERDGAVGQVSGAAGNRAAGASAVGQVSGVEDRQAGVVRPASLGWTGPVSAATADLVGCEAFVRAFVVDGAGVPLSIGRQARLVPPGIRRGLEVRDRGCAFPGCGRPGSWCDAHHIRPWSRGGETSLANGVLLCRMHHTLVHHSGWEVFLGDDGHPWFRPPAQGEGARPEAMRSHARRTMTILPRAS